MPSCVVAFVQSVAAWDLSSSYKYWGGASSVRGAQDNLYNGPLKGGSTGSPGVVDTNALSWVNAQFSSHSYGFYYLGGWPSNSGGFMNLVRMDTYGYDEVNYVRVDLSSYNYAWGQGVDAKGRHPLHATGATGYNDPAGTVTSYDPFSYGSGEKSGPSSACSSAWFTMSYTWGCNWTLSQNNYYLAMDKGTSYPDEPMWY